ncbi:Bgt-70 [Blumeria graminis f. sp. tritici]|uniref:Bgt-70 n=2 Tax=Blumeria graminis f. sp. tritici TaxID=62690 RepID=A0A061HGI2_BLUGR|nr:hypothetical protein BGT96224_70 [Blumeria graminis f. sp. tritici 96224]VDB84052.1 Bgt-70 [Blumeria graminis f. sp. tritici]
MKGPAVDQLVYNFMYPKPKSNDPPNFQGLLHRQLVPEVRLETQAFYGHLSSQEAKYPGLDYSYPPHRARLSRYPWHRRLFRAFDNLALTESEIAGLTKWEGTRWAKERFEREQGIIIRDTTADGIADWVEPELRTPAATAAKRFAEMDEMQDNNQHEEQTHESEEGAETSIDEDGDEESDIEVQSVGTALNERLRAAVAQREAGNSSTIMDEEWEQWFKDAVEAGGLPFLSTDFSPNANITGTRPATGPQYPAQSSRYFSTTRLEQWYRIPEALQEIIRQNSESSRSISSSSSTGRRSRISSASSQTISPSNSSTILSSSRVPINSSFTSRPSLIPPLRRLSANSMMGTVMETDNHPRQWESSRITMRAPGPRLSHVRSIRSTQNQSNGGIS